MYYTQAVGLTILLALSSITSKQPNTRERMEEKVKQTLNYLATKPDTTIQYYKSKMILNIHSDALYLSEANTRNRVTGYFYMGTNPVD